jgi:hypothetical protein
MLQALADYESRALIVGAAARHGGLGSTATAILVGVIATLAAAAIVAIWNLVANRGRRRRERETADQIANLEAMVRRLQEESEAKRPRPTIAFVTRDDPAQAVLFKRPMLPEIDAETIVALERRAALNTAPLIPTSPQGKALQKKVDELAAAAGVPKTLLDLSGFQAAAHTARLALGGPKYLEPTEKDVAAFEDRVDSYETALRGFIPKWIDYLVCRRATIYVAAVIGNDGGAHADDARIRIHFPDPCEEPVTPEEPEPGLPRRPKFEPPLNPDYRGIDRLMGSTLNASLLRDLDRGAYSIPSVVGKRARHGPFYESGSVTVRFDYDIPHHDPITTPAFAVFAPNAGSFDVTWTVHARNLPTPTEGALRLILEDTEPEVEKVTTLEAFLALAPGELDDDGDE